MKMSEYKTRNCIAVSAHCEVVIMFCLIVLEWVTVRQQIKHVSI